MIGDLRDFERLGMGRDPGLAFSSVGLDSGLECLLSIGFSLAYRSSGHVQRLVSTEPCS